MSKEEYKLHRYETEFAKTIEVPGKNGINYWLQEPVVWRDEFNVQRVVPKGIVSDGYSIPLCLRGAIRGLKSRVPSYVHDWQYWTQETDSQKIANWNIRYGMILTGSGRYNAIKVGLGLWLGGWVAWGRYRRELADRGLANVIKSHTASTLEEAVKIANRGSI